MTSEGDKGDEEDEKSDEGTENGEVFSGVKDEGDHLKSVVGDEE